MKLFSILLSMLLYMPFTWSQSESQIRGMIKTADGEGIAYATLMIKTVEDSSLVKAWNSDQDGSFAFQHVDAGRYFLEVTYVGFETFFSEVFELAPDEELVVPDIVIHERTEELEQVVVKAARPIIEIKPDKTVFNVDGSINATGSDALELLRKAPGVVVDNNDNIMLLGKSGVKVYINGKPSHLGTTDLAEYLKTMQSSEIDAIEIITNPSAKYDAEGNAGIINIRLKKDKNLGFNANLNASYSIATYPKINNALNFNYRNKEVNIFGQYGNSVGKWANYNDIYREQAGMAFDQSADMLSDYLNHRFRVGADYFVSEKSTIGFLFNGYNNEGTFHSASLVDIKPMAGQTISILHATNDIDQKRNNLTFNLNYAYNNGEETTLNIDGDYGRFRNDGESYQPNTYMDADGEDVLTERIFASNTPTTIDIYTFKADYEKSLWGGKVGFGGKYTSVNTDNTYDFFDVVDNEQIKNLDRSNEFDYLENVGAAYFSYQRQMDKWNLSIGLRMEHTYSNGELSSDRLMLVDKVEQDYWDWFPTGGLTYQMDDNNVFRLNYSRRLDRPSYQDLNPFEFKLDELTFLKGNAFLNPQYANTVSLSHTFHSKLNTSLSYSVINDLITRITDTLDATATFITFVNLDKQKVVSLAVSYPFTVNSWWNVFTNFGAHRTANKANFEPGKVIDIKATAYNLYAQNTFMIPYDFKLEISGFYQSPFIWAGNFEVDELYSIDVGLQRKLFNDRATLKMSVSDVFNTHKVHGSNRLGDLMLEVWSGWESRQFRVNFNYLLGNQQVKGERRRRTGMDEEQKRIKTENQN
ncbi:MAG: TonB-dependent receptor [Saprospiraceae bacterium]|nr:TonB-dependent receptor [Saprospiraceae bacterium]